MTYFFTNWKMYLDLEESNTIAKVYADADIENDLSVAVFPTALAFRDVASRLKDSAVEVGAQNVAWTPRGAYTGALSAELFANAGATYALVGHSERRYVFGEGDHDVRKKLEAALDAGLTPVLCIGETKEDLDEGKREYRLKKQLMVALEHLTLPVDGQLIVAYEPVWAIGSGDACDPVTVEEQHAFIKDEIAQYIDQDVPLLYGGSVDEDNVLSYVSLSHVDGVLVGGASTKEGAVAGLLTALGSAK